MKKIKNKKNDLTLSKAKMIIHSPIITEKSTKISEFNQFIFTIFVERDSGHRKTNKINEILTFPEVDNHIQESL